ncbi:MAG: lysozyme inhibitor LprI family protein [Ferruginibacter sp.]
MTKIILTTLFCIAINFSFAQTQGELNQNAQKKYKKAETEINGVYQRILKEYSSDQVFIKNLKIAQRLWIQFRDAEMKARFPDRYAGYYGSAQPMCWSMYLTELTEERINKLKVWLTGIEEGDICSGSVKIKP